MTKAIKVFGNLQEGPDKTFYLGLFGNSINSLFTRDRGISTILNDDGSRG
jgi:hypothetical protein